MSALPIHEEPLVKEIVILWHLLQDIWCGWSQEHASGGNLSQRGRSHSRCALHSHSRRVSCSYSRNRRSASVHVHWDKMLVPTQLMNANVRNVVVAPTAPKEHEYQFGGRDMWLCD